MSSPDQKPVPIQLAPGLKRQSTRLAAEGSWYDSEKVRFRTDKPESFRGWSVKSSQFIGTARDLITWQDLDLNPLAGFGTECKLYVYKGGAVSDVTPVFTSATVSITTSAGSPIIVVSGANGGIAAGDYVVFTSANIGTFVLSGEYQAVSVPSNQAVLVSSPTAPVSSAGGASTADFLLPCGASSGAFVQGYGTGTYGSGTYGTGNGGVYFREPRIWTIDTWGEDMLAAVRGGRIYRWFADAGTAVRAVTVSAAPSVVNAVVVSQQDRHAFALGATDELSGTFNPLLIRWCSQENLDDWATSATNTAGSKEVKGGTQLMGGINTRNGLVALTDNAAHFVTYIGPPFTFGVTELGTGIGLIAPNAGVDLDGIAYWMSRNGWYMYDGQVRPLPDDIQRDVFDNINEDQRLKIVAGTNREQSEVIWLYPSASASEIDRYALYNTLTKAWTWGTFTWTAWADRGVFDNILTANGFDARLYDHEIPGYWQANGSPMNSWIESGAVDLDAGAKLMYTDRMIPDMQFTSTTGFVDVYMKYYKYPQGTAVVKGPYRINGSTKYISPRGRGRQASLIVACSAGDAGWELGVPRLYVKEDGFQ